MSWENSREHAEIDAALRAVRAARPPISGKLVGSVVEVAIKHAKVRAPAVLELPPWSPSYLPSSLLAAKYQGLAAALASIPRPSCGPC